MIHLGQLVLRAGKHALACGATDGAPTRFPGYVLERRIARGGMGSTVYLARQIRSGRHVALKVLPRELASDSAVARRFNREVRVMRSVGDANLVEIIDCGASQEGDRFIVMEYLAGGSLAQQLKTKRHFETESAVRLVADACNGLTAIHDWGIVHRDIKPSNLLLDTADNLKVGDFGLARLKEGSTAGRLTESGDVIGTFGYMAPEQLNPKGEVDCRADIYALGAVLYQLLAGTIPGGNAPPPSATRPDAAPYDAVVMRALETNPARRFNTAEEFRRALLDAPDLSRRKALRRIVLGSAAVIAIATGALGVWRTGKRNRCTRPAQPPKLRRRSPDAQRL